jgi:hypothetical protein
MIEVPILNHPREMNALSTLEGMGTQPLIVIKTVFPFRFFPCIITLDREKITISDYLFFFTREVENLLIKDIVSVTTVEDLFFANITLISGLRLNKRYSISFFWKEDARRFRRICEGLRIALKEDVDVLKVDNHSLINRLEDIGTANP